MADLTDMTRADLERMRTALDLILRCSEKAEAAGLGARFHRVGDGFGLTVGAGTTPPVAPRPAPRADARPAAARHIDDAGEPMPPAALPMVGEDHGEFLTITEAPVAAAESQLKPAPQARAVAPNLRAPGWTADEDVRALEMANAGKFAAEIAETLGRPLRGVQQRLRKLRTRGATAPAKSKGPTGRPDPDNRAKAETRVATPKIETANGHAHRPAPAGESWKPSQIDAKTPTAADIDQAETDQEILELLGAGHKAGAVAEMLDVPKTVVVERYADLVPCRTYDGQVKALERVREIVRAGREVRA